MVQMANDIGNFFRFELKREEAIAAIANHIRKYWTPRMREKFLAHLKAHGSEGLDELPREAARTLAQQPAVPARPEPVGGDAG
jgi:formate dehydrogenase subunit delta